MQKARVEYGRRLLTGESLSRQEFLGKMALAGLGVAALGISYERTAISHTGALSHGGDQDAITHNALDGLNSFIRWLENARGYIGEVGIPSNLGQKREPFYPDQTQWKTMGDEYYSRCDSAGLWITAHETSERYYDLKNGGYYASIYLASGDDTHKVINRAGFQSALIEAHGGTGRGVNFSGGQKFDEYRMSNANPGVYNKDYWYPTDGSNRIDPNTGLDSFGYLSSRGVKLVRLGLRWERIQPKLKGPLSTTELKRFRIALIHAREAGVQVIVDLHNYGGYCTNSGRKALNTSALPISAMEDVWRKLSLHFDDHSEVVAYDLMNEPYNHGGVAAGNFASPTKAWEAATRRVVKAIRRRGDTKKIMIPTYAPVPKVSDKHAGPWISGGGDIMYTAHHYFDHYDPRTDGGGGDYPISYSDEDTYYASKGY
jgi:Cellulase (glycosyl hydrolase family 5)